MAPPATPDGLAIAFRPTPEDAAAAAVAIAPKLWGKYERLRLVLAGMALSCLIFFVVASYDWRAWGLFILRWEEIVAFLFAGAMMGWVYGRRRPPLLAADDPRLRERTVTIERDGLRVEGQGYETFMAWESIEQIPVRGGTILFIAEWKDVHFVPKRVFPTPEAADAFHDAAMSAFAAKWDRLTGTVPEGSGA
jgi:hypothetical protein